MRRSNRWTEALGGAKLLAALAVPAMIGSGTLAPAAADGLNNFLRKDDRGTGRDAKPAVRGEAPGHGRPAGSASDSGGTLDIFGKQERKGRPEQGRPVDAPAARPGAAGSRPHTETSRPDETRPARPDYARTDSGRPAAGAGGGLDFFRKPGRPQPPAQRDPIPQVVVHHFADGWYHPYDGTFHRHYGAYAVNRWRLWLTTDCYAYPTLRPEPVTDEERIGRALRDVEEGWEEEDLSLINRYLDDDRLIDITRDGERDYSMTVREFRALTLQAFEDTRTLTFRFTRIERCRPDEVRAEAEHRFVGPDGDRRRVDLTYVLRRSGSRWYLRGIDMR